MATTIMTLISFPQEATVTLTKPKWKPCNLEHLQAPSAREELLAKELLYLPPHIMLDNIKLPCRACSKTAPESRGPFFALVGLTSSKRAEIWDLCMMNLRNGL